MLIAANGLIGCSVKSSDGGDAGTVRDFLFDDRRWLVRWLVLDAGRWLPDRKILIHSSAIAPLVLPPKPAFPMMSFGEGLTVNLKMSKAEIESGPEAREDEPVTHAFEQTLYDFYGWDPFWGASLFGGDAAVVDPSGRPLPAEVAEGRAADREAPPRDPNLGSVADVIGFTVHASDGDLGAVENVLADDANWDIRYLVVSTRHWLPGKEVLLAPYAIADIDGGGRRVSLNIPREKVLSAPAWDPVAMADEIQFEQLHRHFGWPINASSAKPQ